MPRSALAGVAFLCVLVAVPLAGTTPVQAQSAADQATLQDLKTAAKAMQLESDGVPPFRLSASFEAFDFLGRPETQGTWTEEFRSPQYKRTTLRDSNAAENYAPEDQEKMGVAAAPRASTFVQRVLQEALLQPGPTEEAIANAKVGFRTQKVGALSLRCVTLEPKEKRKNAYLQQSESRAYCLAPDAAVIRLTQLEFGIVATYNSLARYGGHTFAQQITLQQRGHVRGKLQVTKLAAAPELQDAALPKVEQTVADPQHNGAIKTQSGVTAGSLLSKVTPVYPQSAKEQHISGAVLLRAIISKEGTIESLEVISAPSDDLAESAIEAVSQWRYKPYLLNGVPTEVDTVVTVNYSFG